MIITDIKVTTFTYTSNTVQDTDGHTHPGDPHEATTALLTITTEDGTSGYTFGSPDALRPVMMDNFIRKVLMGQDATDRERLWQAMARWQRGSGGAFNDRSLGLAELALWDWFGRKIDIPVWKILGGMRDKVPAYGSTMCGDEMSGGPLHTRRIRTVRRMAHPARIPRHQAPHLDAARILRTLRQDGHCSLRRRP